MKKLTLDELIRDVATNLVGKTFAKSGKVTPTYLFETREGNAGLMPAPLFDKDLTVAIVREFFRATDVFRYVFFDEAWTASGTDHDAMTRGSLANYPGRKEIVMIVAEEDAAGMILASREIIRPEGLPAFLGPIEFIDAGNSLEGRMVGLLDGPPNRKKH